MVAAWIRAETGVGPSIASGSQVCSGNCADLPATPASRSSVAATSVAAGRRGRLLDRRQRIEVVPASVSRITTASTTPRSPTRVTRNALTAAARAAARSLWCPTSR